MRIPARSRSLTRLLIVLVVVVALVVAADASAAVRIVKRTSPVAQGEVAVLSVKVSPSARCRVLVVYKTGVSEARGLGAKTGTDLTWRWKVGSNTTPGTWPVTVDCGSSGKAKTTIRVVRG